MLYKDGLKEKETVNNTYILSNFHYYPIVWHFYGKICLHKIEQDGTPLRVKVTDKISISSIIVREM